MHPLVCRRWTRVNPLRLNHLSRWLLLMRHSCLRWHRILARHVLRLRLHVLLIGYLLLLLRCHVVWREVGIPWHVGRWSRYLWMGVDVFRRVDGGFAIHAILIARCGFGRVETGLRRCGSVTGAQLPGYREGYVPESDSCLPVW